MDSDHEVTGGDTSVHDGVACFGPFELETSVFCLWRSGEVVSVQPRLLDLLAYLITHRARVVSVEELIREVWPVSYVVPGVVTTAMASLRKALGDVEGRRRFIRTVRGRGYRFVARVEVRPRFGLAVVGSGQDGAERASRRAREEALAHRPPRSQAFEAISPHPHGTPHRSFGTHAGLRQAPPFVGRTTELALLRGWLGARQPSRPVWLHGPAGMGKTSLVRAAVRELRSRGRAVRFWASEGHQVDAAAVWVVDGLDEEHGAAWVGASLVASRLPAPPGFPGPVLELGPLERHEAVAWLDRCGIPAGCPDGATLVAWLGTTPLALAIASRTMQRHPRISRDELTELVMSALRCASVPGVSIHCTAGGAPLRAAPHRPVPHPTAPLRTAPHPTGPTSRTDDGEGEMRASGVYPAHDAVLLQVAESDEAEVAWNAARATPRRQ